MRLGLVLTGAMDDPDAEILDVKDMGRIPQALSEL